MRETFVGGPWQNTEVLCEEPGALSPCTPDTYGLIGIGRLSTPMTTSKRRLFARILVQANS